MVTTNPKNNNQMVAIVGPTATGKTDLGLILAKKFNGELVACDSRQVYKGLDIGTGKLPGSSAQIQKLDRRWIIDGTPIWMYDVIDPSEQFNVADYVKESSKVIEDILNRGKLPIIVGGTGLYLKALTQDLSQINIPLDMNLREELEALPLIDIQLRLQKLDLTLWNNLNSSEKQNKRRLIRKIETITNPYVGELQNTNSQSHNWNILKIGLTVPKSILDQRIESRLLSRIDIGLISEGQRLEKNGLSLERMKDLGLEYRYLALFLEGAINIEQFTQDLITKIRQYAKRQLTWFKRDSEIKWFDITDSDLLVQVENEVGNWYNSLEG